MSDSSEKIISILAIGFFTMLILWVLQFLKTRKLETKIKRLERKE
jgi:hypothetical protein